MVRATKQATANTTFALGMNGRAPVYLSNATLVQARAWAFLDLFDRYVESKGKDTLSAVYITKFKDKVAKERVGCVSDYQRSTDTATWTNYKTGESFAINSAGGKAKN